MAACSIAMHRDDCGLESRVQGFGVEAFRPFGFKIYQRIARRHVVRVFADWVQGLGFEYRV
jgi:hypothetical protein